MRLANVFWRKPLKTLIAMLKIQTLFYTQRILFKFFWKAEWHDTTYVLMLRIKASRGRGTAILKNKRLKVKKETIQVMKERSWEKMNLVCSDFKKEIMKILVNVAKLHNWFIMGIINKMYVLSQSFSKFPFLSV